jgi:hypothetical protein
MKTKISRIFFMAVALATLIVLVLPFTALAAGPTDSVTGIEISAGSINSTNPLVRVGTTFTGAAKGSLPGWWYAKVNYTPPNPGGGVTNTLQSGVWDLIGAKGSFSGIVDTTTPSTVIWNSAGTIAELNIHFTIQKSFSRAYPGLKSAKFTGTLSHLTFPPTIKGNWEFSN